MLCRPHFEYAIGGHLTFILIENVQRQASKIFQDIKGSTYKVKLLHLGLPIQEYRRAKTDFKQTCKLLNNLDKISIKLLGIRDVATHTRGNKYKLYKNRAKT